MPRYYVHFVADHTEPLPPVAELPSIDADDPVAPVERCSLRAGIRRNSQLARQGMRSPLRDASTLSGISG
jgi:hypothetical protein